MNTSTWVVLILSLTASADEAKKSTDPVLEAFRQQVLETTGHLARGKAVFESDKAACTKCHTTDDSASKAGPKLVAIAEKFNREGLVDAVLKPSMAILAGYSAKVVVTTAGDIHTGIVRTRGKDTLELAIVTGELVSVPIAEIAQETNASVSLMPAGLHQQLSHQELADLVAYLGTLTQPTDRHRNFATPDTIPMAAKTIRLEAIHDASQRFELPLWFDAVPGTKDAFVVLEQKKGVSFLEKTGAGMRKTVFLDMSKDMHTGEFWGVMGMAFHPKFLENRKYYLNYHIRPKGKYAAVVVERQASEDFRRDSGAPSRRVLTVDQEGHMGGMLLFGPDGYLFIGTGDGGPQEDPHGHAQDLHMFDGSILRIDVDGRDQGLEYAIPKSNPFVDHPDPLVRREIWSYGIRQAWRFSFDPATDDLWLGDVGQVTYEEISIVSAGDNLGWNVYEGFAPFSDRYERKDAKYVPPIVSLGRKHGISVTGGCVYRGARNPSFDGVYIFGDFESKRIWGMTQKDRKLTKIRQIGTSPGKIVSFGQDSDGEIYVVGYDVGMIYRVLLEDAVFDEEEDLADPDLAAYRQQVLETTGDATRGKAVFESEKAACTKCHTTDDAPAKAGPKLVAIAEKFNREGLVDAVLKPSMGILAGYTAKVVITTGGDVLTGIVRTRSKETLGLAVVTGELVSVPIAEIAQETNASVSLMPAGLHQALSHQEFADLVAYLGTLKQPPDPRRNFATPHTIPMIAKPIRLEPIHAKSQRFSAPLWFEPLPGTANAYVVLDQRKGVFLLEKMADGTRKSQFLDLRKEMFTGEFWGVMGMAFHPQFLENRKYYLDHHTKGKLNALVVERQATEDFRSDAGVPSRLVLRIDQEGHMGGVLAFGPDGYLYVGTGDGGPQEDPHGHAQDLSLLDGSILRIDVDHRDPGLEYAIPKSNPFVNHPDPLVRQEIWAYGIRNAWRFTFDLANGDLWLGDIGQVTYEEVSIVRAGDNLGWNIYEGFMPFSDGYEQKDAKYVPPIVTLGRKHGISVTGGYVYRGKRSPSYNGVYIFGDYESKRIWGLTQKDRKLTKIRQIGTSPGKIVSFGQDSDGELYVVGYDKGMIYRVRLEGSVFE